VTPITIPSPTYPFTSIISPHAEAVDQSGLDWGKKQGICSFSAAEWFRALRVGQLVGRAYPHASFELLTLIGKWVLWLFLFDDHYCDEPKTELFHERLVQISGRLKGILDGMPHSSEANTLEASLANFINELTARVTPVQFARFTAAASSYLLAVCWEANNRARFSPPPITAYRHVRHHTGFGPTCIALIDIANNFVLAPEDYHHPDVSELIRVASVLVGWCNDILSYPKEAASGHITHSLPSILQHYHKLEISEAIHRSVDIHNNEVEALLLREELILRWANHDLRRFLEGLRYGIAANYEWAFASGRYVMENSGTGVGCTNDLRGVVTI
jgi:Terpene synthase family 2, C-terminal metal binding